MSKTMDILDGTDYTVEVNRDFEGDYTVNVYRESKDQNVTRELVTSRYLVGTATEPDLERLVGEIIRQDNRLEGIYTGKSNEEDILGN